MSQEEDFKKFSDEIDFWMIALSMLDWDYLICQSHKSEDNANALMLPNGRKIVFSLSTKREQTISIEKLAAHEALEALLGDIALLMQRYYSDDMVSSEIHKVINKLMLVLLVFRETKKGENHERKNE